MRWPTSVLAHTVLAAGFTRDQAIKAVAIALAATDGDDAYLWLSTVPGGTSFVGAWAIPVGLALGDRPLNPIKLSEQASIVRRLTGPTGDDWRWSGVYASGAWRKRLQDATDGVNDPRQGIASDVPQRVAIMDETVRSTHSAVDGARASMLGSVEHLRKLV